MQASSGVLAAVRRHGCAALLSPLRLNFGDVDGCRGSCAEGGGGGGG